MNKYKKIRTVKAERDEWIHVDRGGDSDSGCGLLLLLVFGIFLFYALIEIIVSILLVALTLIGIIICLALAAMTIWGIWWINKKSLRVFQSDRKNKSRLKITISTVAVIGFNILVNPLFVALFTSETGRLFWKQTRVNETGVIVAHAIYLLSISLPLYAIVSLLIQFSIDRFKKKT